MRTRRVYVLLALGSISCALVAGLDDKELAPEPDGGVAVVRPDGASAPPRSEDAGEGDAPSLAAPEGEVIADKQLGPTGVAVDDVYVYWGTEGGGDGGIYRRPKTLASPPEPIAGNQNVPRHLAVDNAFVFWNTAPDMGETTIAKLARLGPFPATKPQVVQTNGMTTTRLVDLDLVQDDPWLVWAGTEKITRYTRAGNTKVDVVTSNPVPLLATVVAADATHFYWFNQKNGIAYRRPKGFDDGGANLPTEALSQPLTGVVTPIDLRVEGRDLLLVAQSGAVYRIEKDKVDGPAPSLLVQVGATVQGAAVRNGFLVLTQARGPTDGQVLMLALANPTKQKVLATRQADPRDVVVDGTQVVWTCHGDGTIRRAPFVP